MKRALMLVLATTLTASMLTACGENAEKKMESAATSAEESAKSAVDHPKAEDTNTNDTEVKAMPEEKAAEPAEPAQPAE
ncbi:MAG: hypothetical protein Q8R79_02695 [Legionellaceae bacterium]|nr:hypothetical protein [Legionellaceae bacterium]